MMENLDRPAFVRRYLERGGGECPYCGHKEIEGDFVEMDDGFAKQEVSCALCEGRWTDVYKLFDVILGGE